MPIPTENQFNLSKVKLIKDGGLDVHYEVMETVGSEIYTNKYHVESAKDIHPDLTKLFKRMRPIMARLFNITSFLTLIAWELEQWVSKNEDSDGFRFKDNDGKTIEVHYVKEDIKKQ